MKISLALLTLLTSSFMAQAENWPRFRGPSGQGISPEKNPPLEWSADSNIAWKTAIPGEGWSSPIVHGDRIFLTSTLENGASCRVISLDRKSGALLWNKEVFRQMPGHKQPNNSYATPTPVTDGKHVYAAFNDGSFAAVNFEGELAWTFREINFYSEHGLGASPILHQDLLIMPFDGSSQEDRRIGWQIPWDQAFILALDKNSGEIRWKASRGLSRIAHVTPNILRHHGRDQLISGGGDVIQAFDLETGNRLWSADSEGEGVVPSVVIGDNLIFTTSGWPKLTIRAVRPGGEGDVTDSHIVWEQRRSVPEQASFIYSKPHLFTINYAGIANCLEAETGEVLWNERIGGKHSASPILAAGKIYFVSEEGETTIIEAGPELEVLARNTLPGTFKASPAVSRGNIFLRSHDQLYCIGPAPK
jgi:outer membrane protein assembly factor BamB